MYVKNSHYSFYFILHIFSFFYILQQISLIYDKYVPKTNERRTGQLFLMSRSIKQILKKLILYKLFHCVSFIIFQRQRK